MCLITFAFRPHHAMPLVVAANRDEFYARPAQALHQWPAPAPLMAGRDLQAGGTWLGINPQGRFGAITNIRDLQIPQGARSRGELVSAFLQGTLGPKAYLEQIATQAESYSGFNLLVGDAQGLYFLNSQEKRVRTLAPGIYGLSNATLDTPWPKLVRARSALEHALDNASDDTLFSLLADAWQPPTAQLPETGIAAEMERLLSSAFIQSDFYGTRASTLLQVEDSGEYRFQEKSFGPFGQLLGEVRLSGCFSTSPECLMLD